MRVVYRPDVGNSRVASTHDRGREQPGAGSAVLLHATQEPGRLDDRSHLSGLGPRKLVSDSKEAVRRPWEMLNVLHQANIDPQISQMNTDNEARAERGHLLERDSSQQSIFIICVICGSLFEGTSDKPSRSRTTATGLRLASFAGSCPRIGRCRPRRCRAAPARRPSRWPTPGPPCRSGRSAGTAES